LLPVADVLSDNPYVVDFHARLDEVAATMAKRGIGSAIVMRESKLVGILTTTDICRLLAETLQAFFSPTSGDDAA
jgi:CBS domain-containing protein